MASAALARSLSRNDRHTNQNERKVGRVASQARKRDGTKGGKVGHGCLSSTRPGAGVFIADAISKNKYSTEERVS